MNTYLEFKYFPEKYGNNWNGKRNAFHQIRSSNIYDIYLKADKEKEYVIFS